MATDITRLYYTWLKSRDLEENAYIESMQNINGRIDPLHDAKLKTRFENIKTKVATAQIPPFDYLTSPRVVSIYLFKLVTYALLYGAASAATASFTHLYNTQVYKKHQPEAPNLAILLVLFVFYTTLFVGIFGTALWVIAKLLKGKADLLDIIAEYFIQDNLMTFALDFLIFIVLLTVILFAILMFLQDPRFFRYETEGLRAARAFREIIVSVAGLLILVPYFWVFEAREKNKVGEAKPHSESHL